MKKSRKKRKNKKRKIKNKCIKKTKNTIYKQKERSIVQVDRIYIKKKRFKNIN